MTVRENIMPVGRRIMNRGRLEKCRRMCGAFAKRAACMLLAFITAFTTLTLVPLQAEADEGTAVTNAYVLEIATGVSDGKAIEFFEIKYKGTDGKSYRQFIFPNEDSLANGRKEAASYGSDITILNDMNSRYHYVPDTSVVTAWDATGQGSGLQSASVDQYYFTTEVAIQTVEKIDGFIGGTGTWTCNRFQLFRVDKIGGLRMAGVWSNVWYIDFEGELIAEVTGRSGSWSSGIANYLHMDTGAVLKTDFTGVDYRKHVMQDTHTYGFRMDFADAYGAGLESLAMEYGDTRQYLSSQVCVAEEMTYIIQYTDIYGQIRFLRLPVITSVAYWTFDKVGKQVFWGIGQQGESIAFAGTIPDCAEIKDVSCTFGAAEATAEAGIKYNSSYFITKRRIARSEEDDIRLTCAAVYDMSRTTISASRDGARLNYSFTGDPILYRLSGDTLGDPFYAQDKNMSLHLLAYDGRKLEVPEPSGMEYYLVQIATDDIGGAATTSELYMTLNYVDRAGRESSSSEIALSTATGDYYGYWPGSTDNFVYKWGVNSGNTVTAVITLRDVDYFTGVKLKVDEGSSGDQYADDYQFKSLQIYALSSLGTRKVVWQEQSKNGMNTRVNITRETKGKAVPIKILNVEETVLVQQGEAVSVDFQSAKVTDIQENSWEMSTISVTYEDAMADFNFTKVRKTYNITVHVFDDTVATDDQGRAVSTGGNGDAGSENLFYFQLLFKNGASCYELANSQLEGDRFASGADESFQISTNQDYGEVTAIRIIPDDTSTDSKKFDKLRIDSIDVTEVGQSGTHVCWVARDVGWIGVGYTEEQEKSGMGGQRGRSAAEMGKTKSIDYTTNVVQLEVAIHTNNQAQDPGYASQYYGTLWGQFTVVLNNGERKTLDKFDVVRAMYQYMNKNKGEVSGGVISDKSKMFRVNHTDRFLVDIKDVRQIVSLDLYTEQKDTNPYNWGIGSVSVSKVKEQGRLRLNTSDEYEYERTEKAEILCYQRNEGNPPHLVKTLVGTEIVENIPFTENLIELDESTGQVTSKISRVPASQNDELNIFVFPTIGAKQEPIANYELNVTVNYAHVYGPLYQVGREKISKYTPAEGDTDSRPMFYATGLKASGMVDLNKVKFSAMTNGIKMCNLDYAIVQQVRDGVVVANYYMNLANNNAYYSVTAFPTGDTKEIGYKNEQVVTFQFADSTEERNLFADRQDMAVALKYRLANNPEGPEYLTPYIYLTDQGVVNIRPGQVVDLKFGQMFAGEVTGIQFACIGDTKATIDAACVTTYRTDTSGKPAEEGHYNFSEGVYVTETDPVTMWRTTSGSDALDAVNPVTLTFKTSAASKNVDSGTSGPVHMDLYTSRKGSTEGSEIVNPVLEKKDIRTYLVDGSKNFETDKLQTVRFLVTGAESLRRIVLEPKNEDGVGNATWSLDYVTAQLGDKAVITRAVEERIYEGQPKTVTLANVIVAAQVSNFNTTRDAYDIQLVQEKGVDLDVLAEKDFIVTPQVKGSELGSTVTIVEVKDGTYVTGELADSLTQEGNDYIFTPPKTEKTKYYRITVASYEVPESKVEINITVEGTEATEQQQQTNTGGTGTGDGNGTGTGDGNGTGTGEGSSTGTGDGNGTGTGDGNGTGTGEGSGTGTGDGSGTGTEDNSGTGTGDGSSTEPGDGSNTGTGDGNGTETGDGSGTGTGDNSGTGTGDGSGTGTGDGNGTETGDGSGTGTGDGSGDAGTGDGSGTGTGDGSSDAGTGEGSGTGTGDGSGTGTGEDSGTGTGENSGPATGGKKLNR